MAAKYAAAVTHQGVGSPVADYRTLGHGAVRRVRAVGSPSVPLVDNFIKATVFVLGARTDRYGAGAQEAIGTAFFVSVPTAVPDTNWRYVVTAKHVVACETETWVRLPHRDGSLQSHQVPEWTVHPTADVAVAFVGAPDLNHMTVPEAQFSDGRAVQDADYRPLIGARIYFIGLLVVAGPVISENIPMVRSGTIGRLYQPDVPLRGCDNVVTRQEAHLVDVRSFGGFSGSPCFWQVDDLFPLVDPNTGEQSVSFRHFTALIGLISGHFDDPRTAVDDANRPINGIRFPTNSGVGVVTPVERIRECLMDEGLVEQRRVADANLIAERANQADQNAAVPHETGEPTPPHE
jgi:hypothetical protein